jgi:hypothetical protein
MNNQNTSSFEEKIHQATRLPEPSLEFTNRLWDQIVETGARKSIDLLEPESAVTPGLKILPDRKLPGFRLQVGIALALAVLLVGIILVVTPGGRALAQNFLRFFTHNASNIIPAPTEIPLLWVEQTPGVAAPTATPFPGPAFSDECGNYPNPTCTVEQIRNKVDFPVKEIRIVPTPMNFIGATGGPDVVFILYSVLDHSSGLILYQQPYTESLWQTSLNVGASAVVETVKIGSINGEYVKGIFTYHSGETQEVWDANADVQRLRWVDNGVFYQMENDGVQLDRGEFIVLARDLTTDPVSASFTPPPENVTPAPDAFDLHTVYPLAVAEVEKKAGFHLAQPSKLPAFLSLLGASFDPEQKIASIFYLYSQDMGPSTNGLLLQEEIIPSSGAYDLGRLIVGDKTQIDKYAPGMIVGAIENVQIGEFTGQYVEGTWHGTDCCGWTWESDPYLKRLRWQTDGMAFELSYMGMDISKEDMVTIALSMK